MADRRESAEKFLENPSFDCYVSSSVKKKIVEGLDDIYNWLQSDIKENFSNFLHRREIEEITRRDVLLFELFLKKEEDN